MNLADILLKSRFFTLWRMLPRMVRLGGYIMGLEVLGLERCG